MTRLSYITAASNEEYTSSNVEKMLVKNSRSTIRILKLVSDLKSGAEHLQDALTKTVRLKLYRFEESHSLDQNSR